MYRSVKNLWHLSRRFAAPPVYGFSNEDKSEFVPAIIAKNKDFHKNIYGIVLDKHIFPHESVAVNWKLRQMKQYRKKIPKYFVVLVRKVLENAAQLSTGEEEANLKNKFYQISTYCQIEYDINWTELIGLYRVKVNKIQEVKEYGEENKEENKEEKEQILLNYQQNSKFKVINKQGIDQQSQTNDAQKLNLNLYALEVQKIEEPLLNLNHQFQIKMKYLLQTYKRFYSSSKDHNFLLFNPNENFKTIYSICQKLSNDNFKPKQIQEILEINDYEQKINAIQQMMLKTQQWKKAYNQLQQTAQKNIRNKKFYQYYIEIFKLAKQKLDGKKGKQLFLQKVSKSFEKMKPPKEIKEIFYQQKQKYRQMEQSAVQAGVVKKYLEDLSKIPYSIKSVEIFDLQAAEKALDQQHYGMKDVKDAILQIIAVGKLRGTLKGKIFCFIGGPGLGKTTIAKSIANALGRKFYNISLGGVTDSSVLKGHRRTYVGAYSGKIIEALKHCETNNPVILLDQIDKMGSGSQGDPRSELLQILDPNQNSSFVDNYIDQGIDLSNVLFICSANYEKAISKPLLDRMENIYLNSYTDDEKKEIFNRHLLRRAINNSGVKEDQFKIQDEVIESLIYDYSLGQPGVRRLEKSIQKILEKIAFKIVQENENLPIKVNKNNLRDYLGNSYRIQRDHHTIGVGMAISLGGGDYGSRLTYIQSFKKSFANKKEQKRGVMFTGSLGDVFKEAMNISYTYARNFLLSELRNKFLFQNEVHIHAPDGAAKKDGSTDSLTIVSSLVSLALNKEIKKGIAMTGEITLHGKVLRTHDIKQKVLLARRQKIWQVIIPAENKADVAMLSQNIREGIQFHFVHDFAAVYSLLFGESIPLNLGEKMEEHSKTSRVQNIL